MRRVKMPLLMALLVGGFAITSSLTLSKPEYSKKEGKPCTYCHVKIGSKDLNDVGKCYQKNKHSLKGCEPKEEK